MATLKAHGVEIVRVTVTTADYVDHVSFRSDGHVLKRTVGLNVHPGESDPSRRRHDWGWKVWMKYKAEVARDQKRLVFYIDRRVQKMVDRAEEIDGVEIEVGEMFVPLAAREPTPGCKQWGCHRNPTHGHCNRCASEVLS